MGLDCPHCAKTIDGWVPEDRLKKATADKREATTKLAELATQGEELTAKGGNAEEMQAELEKLRTPLETTSTGHARQIDVMRHGITDPDDVADLLAIFERRAPEGSNVGDWLTDRDSLPRSVSALLGSTTPAAAAAPAAAPPEAVPSPPANGTTNGTPLPSSNAGAVPVPPAPSMPTPAEIGQMTTEQYKKHRDHLLASLTSAGPSV